MKWDRLKYFHIVSQTLNLKKASDIMNISHSSLSRQISLLENEMKMKLFFRNSKGLSLSPEGKNLFTKVNEIYSRIENIKDIKSSSEPVGKLRVASTNAFGALWITPELKSLLQCTHIYKLRLIFGIQNQKYCIILLI